MLDQPQFQGLLSERPICIFLPETDYSADVRDTIDEPSGGFRASHLHDKNFSSKWLLVPFGVGNIAGRLIEQLSRMRSPPVGER